MLGKEFHKAVTEIMDLSGRDPVCLMCAEVIASKCHRSLVADHLTAQGWEVIHLLNRSEYKRHRLSPHARIQEGQVFYDRPFHTQYAFDLST
jgi:uncharacterized protein (DUF488 family)